MRALLFVASIIFFSNFLTSQVSAAEINLAALEKLAEESLAQRTEPMVSQHPSAQHCLLVDFEALVFDIFYNLNKQNKIADKKFDLIKQGFKKLGPEEFKNLKEERFDSFNSLAWHPMAMIDVESFKTLVFITLISHQELAQIESDLKNLREDHVVNYAINIFNSLAQEYTLNNIIELWIQASHSQKAQELRFKSGCILF